MCAPTKRQGNQILSCDTNKQAVMAFFIVMVKAIRQRNKVFLLQAVKILLPGNYTELPTASGDNVFVFPHTNY